MLTRNDFLSLNFVKKEDFTGSYKGIRFLLRQETEDDEKKLKVFLWSEPFGFEATDDDKKLVKLFDFSEDGLSQAIDWLNENYEDVKYTKEPNKKQPT